MGPPPLAFTTATPGGGKVNPEEICTLENGPG